MYRIKIIDKFSSAHQLIGYKGKCEEVHGHNWKVELEIEGEELDDIGLLMDFRDLKELLWDVIKELDHCMLNSLKAFQECNPSSELIARYIYYTIKDRLPSNTALSSVSVWESDNARAVYFEKS